MYPSHLGKFSVPDRTWGRYPGGWVPEVVYTPEPPIVVRGAMNPWQDERQRVYWQAEEKAWVEIQKKQATYRQIYTQLETLIRRMNAVVAELEGLTGKKAGFFTVQNIGMLLASSSGNPYVIAAMFLKMFVFDSIFGNKKKKKIEALVQQLEAMQAQAKVLVQRLHDIEDQVSALIQTGDAIRSMQQVKMTEDIQQSEGAFKQRQQLDRVRAAVLRERNRQVALMPRTPGGSDVL